MSLHDPHFADQRVAALLAGVPADTRAPGLARLLTSLMPKPAEAEPPPPPAIDLAALLAEARSEGEAAGRAAGHAAGHAAATAELAPVKAAMESALAAARALVAIDDAALRPLLADLVATVTRAVLMAELKAGARVLMPLVDAALAEVADGALPTLSAHPDTLTYLARELPPGLVTAADPALPAQHIVLSGPDYRVEAGLEERLARIAKALA